MVELQIMGLALDEGAKTPLLLMKAKKTDRILSIWVGATEAIAISLALNGIPMPRPLTHDLLLNCIYSLGATIERVEITGLVEGMYMAELVLSTSASILRMDSRPSDAVALALRAGKPIMVADDILQSAGTFKLQTLESGSAQFYSPSETPELLATLFTMPDSPAIGEARLSENKRPEPKKEGEVKAMPQITISVTSVERHGKNAAPKVNQTGTTETSSEKSFEDILRELDPETKYRM